MKPQPRGSALQRLVAASNFATSLSLFARSSGIPRMARRQVSLWATLAAVTVLGLIATPGTRADTIVQFALDNIVFQDGSTTTGTFTLNETTDTLVQWDMIYTGTTFPSDIFRPSNFGAFAVDTSGAQLLFAVGFDSTAMYLSFAAPLTNVIAVPETAFAAPLGFSAMTFGGPGPYDFLIGGSVDPVSPVPEPPILFIVGGAVGVLLLTRGFRHPNGSEWLRKAARETTLSDI